MPNVTITDEQSVVIAAERIAWGLSDTVSLVPDVLAWTRGPESGCAEVPGDVTASAHDDAAETPLANASSARRTVARAAVLADLAAVILAYVVALTVRTGVSPMLDVHPERMTADWSLVLCATAVLAVFYLQGLYELEAFAARALHAWAIASGAMGAFLATALVTYLVKSDSVDQSRFVLALTFLLFVSFAGLLRLFVVDRVYLRARRSDVPTLVVVGDSPEAVSLAERLTDLRGPKRVERIAPDALRPVVAESLYTAYEHPESHGKVDAVFIDTSSVSPREVFTISGSAWAHGTAVYVVSGILGPLDGSSLLRRMLGQPVVRVRRGLAEATPYPLKRVFDILGSTALLLLCAPLMAVLAALVRLSSPGPVFYRQTRVGQFGVPFEFLKFRSMRAGNDATGHREYVAAFIHGTADACVDQQTGEAVFKQVDDPRITPIGRFMRKYSLDELPQFLNVLRGDMSLVGPRPPLAYEVAEYDEWHRVRLAIPPGVTGVWQAEGRSRVSFEQMILQDLLYAQNMGLLVDVMVCLRTVPAALSGAGGG